MKILLMILPLALIGCSTIQPNEHSASVQREALQIQAQIAARPTVTIECVQGCTATYNDPRQNGLEMPTNAYDADIERSRSTARVINRVVPIAAGAWLGSEVVNALGDAGSFINNGRIDSDDTNNSNQGNVLDSGNTNLMDSGNTADNSINDSGNTNLTDSQNDNSDNSDNSQVYYP